VGASVGLAPGQGSHAGHDARTLALALTPSLDVASGGHAAHMNLKPAMIAAHALAAFGAYAVLRRADVFLESGRRWTGSFLSRLRVPFPWRPAPLGITAPAPRPTPRCLCIVTSPSGLRGPPLSLA